MLKQLLIFILAFNFIYADDLEQIPRSDLEAFIFKMGFESLLKDVAKDKNITLSNKTKIEIIQKEIEKNRKDLDYLLEHSSSKQIATTNKKIILTQTTSLNTNDKKDKIIKAQKKQIKLLKHDIKILKSMLIKLQKKDKFKSQKIKKLSLNEKLNKIAKATKQHKTKKYKLAIVKRIKAKLRKKPYFGAKIIKIIYKGEKFKISKCDKFGWCKVAHKKEYIPKFVLKFK